MNDDIPCRVTADLRRHEAEQGRILDAASYMDQAREEIIEKLLGGKQVGRFTFADILDCEVDDRGRCTLSTVADLMLEILAYAKDDCQHGERRAKVEQWVRGLCERFIDGKPELIEEWAAEIAALEAENAEEQ